RAIGLRAVERDGEMRRLGAEPGRPLVELVASPDAPPASPRSTGLFHLALLVPERAELARALRRALEAGGSLTGASDHLVSEALYAGVLGFDVIVRSYPGALFVSAGGYHHHIGLNTWNSASAPAPPAGSRGLREFEVVLPGADELARVRGRIDDAGIEARE